MLSVHKTISAREGVCFMFTSKRTKRKEKGLGNSTTFFSSVSSFIYPSATLASHSTKINWMMVRRKKLLDRNGGEE
jgi:hypothetical protein